MEEGNLHDIHTAPQVEEFLKNLNYLRIYQSVHQFRDNTNLHYTENITHRTGSKKITGKESYLLFFLFRYYTQFPHSFSNTRESNF